MPLDHYTFSLFVVHAQEQKGIVKQMIDEWQRHGLKVAYDGDFVVSGLELRKQLKQVARQSRELVVCLSPECLESAWCSEEIESYLDDDARDYRRAHLPLLAPIEKDKLHRKLLDYLRLDLTTHETRHSEYTKLCWGLGISKDATITPIVWDGDLSAARPGDELVVRDVIMGSDLSDEDFERLIKKILGLGPESKIRIILSGRIGDA